MTDRTMLQFFKYNLILEALLAESTERESQLRRVSGNFFFRVIVFFIQFCLPIAAALTVVKALMPSISDGFGVLLASGFIGGPGTGLRYDRFKAKA